MANPHKGEFAFEAGGEKFTLCFSADAVCNLEDALELTINQIGEAMQNAATLRLSTVRTMFGFALKDRHPDLDDARVKDIFKMLTAVEAIVLVSKAFAQSFGQEEAAGAGANPPKPGAPADGTGPAS